MKFVNEMHECFIENFYFLQLEHSLNPTIEEILELKPVFETYNFQTERLSLTHTVSKMTISKLYDA
jgi:hypothetical protein